MKAILLMGLITASCLSARDRIAYIGFYGYQGLDLEAIRKALPVHNGDAYGPATLEQIRAMVLKVTGKPATEVAPVCCLNDRDRAIFIGLSGESTRVLNVNPAPTADLRLSAAAHLLYRRMSEAEQAASRKGENGEEGTGGFRLSKDPEARAAELKVRDYALQHEPELVRVLGISRYPDERSKAADVLGYGARSQTQIAALVHAALDPVSDVRNESTRALGEILEADPSVTAQVDAGPYLALVKSGIWTDRNKGGWVLEGLTKSNDPALLARIRAGAWAQLIEMAQWSEAWRIDARMAIARIAGIPETRWGEVLLLPNEEFLRAVNPR